MQPREYWESRLERDPGLTGTGHRAFDGRYNAWLYRALREAVEGVLDERGLELAGRSILDVGSGGGFWLDVLSARGPARLSAVEWTRVAARRLEARYPRVDVRCVDISSPELELPGPFDLVTAISVLFHVVDDAAFERALSHLAANVAPGGWLLLSGVLRKRRLPAAAHVRFRPRSAYAEPLERAGLEILEVRPVLYLLQRTFIPFVGPALVNSLRLGALFYRIDRFMSRRRWPNGFQQKLLVARRPPQA
ncbi:MAG: class I SAM-dependent methyltransferase [Thermoanaerobaculia bacterium]